MEHWLVFFVEGYMYSVLEEENKEIFGDEKSELRQVCIVIDSKYSSCCLTFSSLSVVRFSM